MGVVDLWKLLSTTARTMDIKSLKGTTAAIDVSIWMIKILHGMAQVGTKNFQNVHLIGIMRRIIFLLQQGIKPVFVFDGPPPELKRQTLIHRQQSRLKNNMNLQKMAEKYIVQLMEKGIDVLNHQEAFQETDGTQYLEEIEQMLQQQEEEEQLEQIPEEELEIERNQQHEILNLKFDYLLQNQIIDFSKEEFVNMSIEEKVDFIQNVDILGTDLDENKTKLPMNESSKDMLRKYVKDAQFKEQVKKIQIETRKQIQQLRIDKLLEELEEEEKNLIKDYLNSNEDLQLQLIYGYGNLYLHLKDTHQRNELLKQIRINRINVQGDKNKKKKKLKDWQLENEHMNNIRERLKKRYQIKNQIQTEEQELEPNANNSHESDELFDKLDIIDFENLDEIMYKQFENIEQNCDMSLQGFVQQNDNSENQLEYIEMDLRSQSQHKVYQSQEVNEVQNNNDKYENENDSSKSQISQSSDQFQQAQNDKDSIDSVQELKFREHGVEVIMQHQTTIPLELDQTTQAQKQTSKNEEIFFAQPKIKSADKQIQDMKSQQIEIDQLLEQIDNQQDQVSTDEMIQNIMKYTNMNNLDFGNLQNKFEEVRYLLSLFGIPWVMAPGEAEAQCAFLQNQGLVDCVITEDSDVFLFGGERVIKGLFDKNCELHYYDMKFISEELGLTRDKLIYLALFLGSDYTPGIKGVGIVNAMEIVEAFDCIPALQRFQSWAQKADVLLENKSAHYENIPEKERLYKEMHKNYKKYWELPEDFPSQVVIQEYLKPRIDESKEKFAWGVPALEKIDQFCQNILEWDQDKVKQNVLEPVSKLLETQNSQSLITDYFRPKLNSKIAIINSRRIKESVKLLVEPSQQRSSIQQQSKRKTLNKIYEKKQNTSQENEFLDEEVQLEEFKYSKIQRK